MEEFDLDLINMKMDNQIPSLNPQRTKDLWLENDHFARSCGEKNMIKTKSQFMSLQLMKAIACASHKLKQN